MVKDKIKQYKPNWQRLLLELLVVFLGVSSGFILNNKRDDYKDKKLEYIYIESFIRNIDTNIVALKINIEEDSVWVNATEKRIGQIQSDNFPKDSMHVLVNSVLGASKALLITSTYEDIKSSGNFNIIRDFNIKESIISYHSEINSVRYVDGYYNAYFRDISLPFALEKYNMTLNKFIGKNPESKYLLYNIVLGNYSMRTQRTQVFIGLLESSEELKKDLQEYLEAKF